jgi:hypothetical protein
MPGRHTAARVRMTVTPLYRTTRSAEKQNHGRKDYQILAFVEPRSYHPKLPQPTVVPSISDSPTRQLERLLCGPSAQEVRVKLRPLLRDSVEKLRELSIVVAI